MATAKKATKTRRSVSKARLYKEIVAAVDFHDLTDITTVNDLLEAIKNDIVDEALTK